MKKKYLKIIIIVFVIVLIICGIIFAVPIVKEKLFFNRINNIEYDVEITKHTKRFFVPFTGGYSVNYDLINLEERKLYSISYSGILGDRPDNYGVTTKELKQEEIQEIIKLSNMKSEEVDKEGLETYNKHYKNNHGKQDIIVYVGDDEYYWVIEYKGRKIELNRLPFSEEILKIN